MTKGKILATIEALQSTRKYADEVESVRLTNEISRLITLLEKDAVTTQNQIERERGKQ